MYVQAIKLDANSHTIPRYVHIDPTPIIGTAICELMMLPGLAIQFLSRYFIIQHGSVV